MNVDIHGLAACTLPALPVALPLPPTLLPPCLPLSLVPQYLVLARFITLSDMYELVP